MATRIELGSFNRGDNAPILLKNKSGADGSPSVRIYQRKDLGSINSLKDRIKTMIKYSIEDFLIAHKKLQPLLETIGFSKINQLNTQKNENPRDLLQKIKSFARIGSVDKAEEEKLKKILKENDIPEDFKFTFYKGEYKNEDFFIDLRNIKDKINSNSIYFINDLNFEKYVKDKYIFSDQKFEEINMQFKNLEQASIKYFKDEKTRLEQLIGSKNQNDPDISSLENKISTLEALQKEFLSKITQIKNEVSDNSQRPTNEAIKKYLKTVSFPNSPTGKAIDILFSTSWLISEESRQEAQQTLKTALDQTKEEIPKAVRDRIFPIGDTPYTPLQYDSKD